MIATVADRLAVLNGELRRLGSVVVAFSGGADSALLLAAAARELGPDRVLAATSTSDALATGEAAAAADFAESLGVAFLAVATAELERDGYRQNGADRCYHCKSELGDRLLEVAQARGFAAVATGTNADDVMAPHRPGLRAAAERGIVTPLATAGLTKADVRALSRDWGLPTWDKPQAACLASRIAYGVAVDADRLRRVDRAEAALRAELDRVGIPVVNLRVRDLGDRAGIEVDAEFVPRVRDESAAVDVVAACGFAEVTVDSRGFRSGALNDVLAADQLISGAARSSTWDLPLLNG